MTQENYPPQPHISGSLSGTELVEVDNGGATRARVTTQQIANLGGGGGGSSFSLTAATNIAAGTGVSVNASGQAVQTWGPAPNVAGIVELFGGVAASPAALVLSSKAVFFYSGGAQACSISGTTLSVPGAVETGAISQAIGATAFGPSATAYVQAAALTSTTFVALYNDSGTGNVNAVVGSIDGSNTITYGTPVQLFAQAAAFNGAGVCSVALSATLALFNIPLHDGTQSTVACSVSGTTLTPSVSAVQVSNNAFGGAGIAKLTATTAALLYVDGNNSGFVTAVVASLAGTVITLGTPKASTITASVATFISALSATLIVVGGQGAGNTFLAASTVSGSTLSNFGTAFTLAADGQYLWIYPVTGTTAVVQDPMFSVSVSGTTITQGSVTQNNTGITGTLAVCGSTIIFADLSPGVTIYEEDMSGNISPGVAHPSFGGYWLYEITSTTALATLIAGSNNNTPSASFARIVSIEAINPSPPIGATAVGATNGNPVTIQNGGVCAGFTGLTAGTAYYWNGDGTITSGNTGHPAGTAVSSTQLALA